MNKFIATLFAVVLLIGISTPSYAGNSDDVAIGILGGVVGGLVLGEILERPPQYREPVRVYEYDDYEPYMVQRCRTKFVRYYDSMGNLTRRAVRKCYWVEQY